MFAWILRSLVLMLATRLIRGWMNGNKRERRQPPRRGRAA